MLHKTRQVFEDLSINLADSFVGRKEDIAEFLENISVLRCELADQEHDEDPRVYCHASHEDEDKEEGVICCSSATDYLSVRNITGILAHEIGHLIHLNYSGIISGVESYLDENFEIEIDFEHGVQFFRGVQVDHEIFADVLMELLFGLRIWYDEDRVQWVG